MVGTQGPHEIFKTVIQMLPDQGTLGLMDRFFHCLQLLRDIQAGTPLLQHEDGAAQVPTGSAQAFDEGWMRSVCVRLSHD